MKVQELKSLISSALVKQGMDASSVICVFNCDDGVDDRFYIRKIVIGPNEVQIHYTDDYSIAQYRVSGLFDQLIESDSIKDVVVIGFDGTRYTDIDVDDCLCIAIDINVRS